MQNPFQNHTAGNMGAMNDPLAFVKKLWGDMQLPGMVTPTLSIDELDKQIKDLKTVESWLTVNMNMLKGTIQALEVQRATIAALKSMGESFAQATSPDTESTNKSAPTGFSSRWPMPETSAPKTAPRPVVPEPALEDEMDEDDESELAAPEVDAPVADEPISKAAAAPETEAATKQKKLESKQDQASQPELAGFSNPAAWWTVLQDQFKQALSHAMQDEVAAKTAKDAVPSTKSSTKVAAKPSSKTVPKAKSKVVKATVKESSAGKSSKAKAAVKTTAVKTASPSKSATKPPQKTPPISNRKPKLN